MQLLCLTKPKLFNFFDDQNNYGTHISVKFLKLTEVSPELFSLNHTWALNLV